MMTLKTRSIIESLTFGKPYNVVEFERDYLTIRTLEKYCKTSYVTIEEKVKDLDENEILDLLRMTLEDTGYSCYNNGTYPDYILENHKYYEVKRTDCIVIEGYKD